MPVQNSIDRGDGPAKSTKKTESIVATRSLRRQLLRKRSLFEVVVTSKHTTNLGWLALLWCCALHHNIQPSTALIRNGPTRNHHGPALATRSGIQYENSILRRRTSSSILLMSTTEEQGTTASSFATSLKTLYKPTSSGQFTIHKSKRRNHSYRYSDTRGDFRNHDEQQRAQLDWIVRNTAKILGDDAPGALPACIVRYFMHSTAICIPSTYIFFSF